MIEKVVKILDLKKDSSIREDLIYWLRKTPEERIAAIEFLRRQYHGSSERLQRVARVIQRPQGLFISDNPATSLPLIPS